MHKNSWIQEGKRENQAKGSLGVRAGLDTSEGRICGHSLQVRGSQPGVILPCRGISALSRDIFSGHSWREVATGTLQCIRKPESFKIVQNYLVQNVSRAKVEKPYCRLWQHSD